jgi:hypothetical protein
MGRDGLGGSCHKMVLNHGISIAVYLQSVGRKCVHAALCSTGYGTLELARKLYRQPSITGVITVLKIGTTVTPSGSS